MLHNLKIICHNIVLCVFVFKRMNFRLTLTVLYFDPLTWNNYIYSLVNMYQL